MPKPVDIFALLRRGGDMTAAEEKQLLEEWQEAKLTELSGAIFCAKRRSAREGNAIAGASAETGERILYAGEVRCRQDTE